MTSISNENTNSNGIYFKFICRLPLGLVSPFGYFICWCIITAAIFCIYSSIIPLLCLYLGECWVSYSIIKDISKDLSHLNGSQASTSRQSHPLNGQELKVQFCKIVKLFSDFKELSSMKEKKISTANVFNFFSFSRICRIFNQVNTIAEFLIFILFSWGLLTIISTLLIFLTELVIKFAIKFSF